MWLSRRPAPVKNSRTEVAGDPDIFPRSVLDAPPLFSFQLPSTPSVPSCPPVGKWAGLTLCYAKMAILPEKWYEKVIAIILIIAVMGFLVPTVIGLAYNRYVQGRMLSRVDDFIQKYGQEMKNDKFKNIERLFGYTGDGGRLGVIYHGVIDKSELENYVSSKDNMIRIMYFDDNDNR